MCKCKNSEHVPREENARRVITGRALDLGAAGGATSERLVEEAVKLGKEGLVVEDVEQCHSSGSEEYEAEGLGVRRWSTGRCQR